MSEERSVLLLGHSSVSYAETGPGDSSCDRTEAELNRLWKRRAEIDQMLSAPQSNGGPSVGELMKTRAEIERHLATAEHRWLEASEAAERARVESAPRG